MSKRSALLAVLLIGSADAIAATSHLPFIEDDYPKALATAKQRSLPVFVEVSAPW